MAFDPDAFLRSAPAPSAGFNPDAWLAANPAPKEEPGALEALGRGALQGATFGFGDEITGAVQSLFGPKSYEQARDEARANNAAASAAHPNFYGAGELGGGLATALVPGLGVAKGASALKVGLQGAALGGLGALGTSEAKDATGIAKDVGEGAAVGGVGGALLHGIGSKVGDLLGRAPEMADEQAIKALAQGEGKAGAAWSKTRGMVRDPGVSEAINEKVPFDGKNISLADIASKPAEEVRPVIKASQSRLGEQLDTIYDRADKKSGGVAVSDLVKHYDDQIALLSTSPGNTAFVKALEDTKADILKSWAPKLADALTSEEAENPKVREALLREFDVKVPSRDVRAFATTLQDRGSDTVDRLNPGLGSQVKKALGSMTRDFVNEHVENVLGGEDAGALKKLNSKMTSLYRIDDVLADRESKEAAGRISQKGNLAQAVGHLGVVGSLLHGNIPAAIGSLAIPKVIEQAPAVGRFATRGMVGANALLSRIAAAADAGNPWAARQLAILRSTPQGLARLGALNMPNAGGQ